MNIIYICQICGKCHESNPKDCSACGCSSPLFRVANRDLPRMIDPDKNVYYHNNTKKRIEEDGYKYNTPGSVDDIGGSGFGPTNFRRDSPGYQQHGQNNYIPTGGSSEGEGFNGEDTSSWKFMTEHSPLHVKNKKKEPFKLGPHNMQSRLPFFRSLNQSNDTFDKIHQQIVSNRRVRK